MNADYSAQQNPESQARGIPQGQPVNQRAVSLPHCANCDIEISWLPITSGGLTYCCWGCAQGGPCSCDYSEHASLSGGAGVPEFPSDQSCKYTEGSEQRG